MDDSYRRLERVTLVAGAVAVLALVAATAYLGAGLSQLVGLILLWPVLAVALHVGRRLGSVAALLATAICVVLTIPSMASPAGLQPAALVWLAACIVGYGFLGILGGEIAGRMRYLYTRLEESSAIDEWSRAYNQRFAAARLERSLAEQLRYDREFSAVVLTLPPNASDGGTPKQRRAASRAVTNHLRGDLRMVDDVARLDDGRFLLLLPQTTPAGAKVVAQRVSAALSQLLERDDGAVSASCLSASADRAAIAALARELASTDAATSDQEPSGAYSSRGASDLNPESLRTSSAP